MPEVTSHASILIATSFQALDRVIKDNKETEVSDSTIVILFATFFIEANLNHIRNVMNKKEIISREGLYSKIKKFYNQFIGPLPEGKGKFDQVIDKLEYEFNGFKNIYDFRNKISHGEVDLVIANRKTAEELRQKAKDIVNKLYEIVKEKTGIEIPRDITYTNAIFSSK